MKNYSIIFVLFAFSFLVSSCSVEKRLYSSGYYVQWHHKKTKHVKQVETNIPNRLISVDIDSVEIYSIPKQEFLPLATLNARPKSEPFITSKPKVNSTRLLLHSNQISGLLNQYQISISKTVAKPINTQIEKEKLTTGDKIVLIFLGVLILFIIGLLIISNSSFFYSGSVIPI